MDRFLNVLHDAGRGVPGREVCRLEHKEIGMIWNWRGIDKAGVQRVGMNVDRALLHVSGWMMNNVALGDWFEVRDLADHRWWSISAKKDVIWGGGQPSKDPRPW